MEHHYRIVRHRNQSYILIDVTAKFPIDTPNEEDRLIVLDEFQECANEQGIKGKIVLIWPNKDRKVIYFSRPSSDLRHLFKNQNYDSIISESDGKLTCSF